jgi:prepilin-type N-terminal cleavage/methylation domain-containing protein
MRNSRKTQGFTLIEILVVVALIAILAAITFIAINPAKNFADARNTQRQSDVREILSAITQYTSEQGHSIAGLGTIADCATAKTIIGSAGANLETTLVSAYIVGIPKDPLYKSTGSGTPDATDVGYTVCQTAGRIQIDAPNAENGKSISVKR